MKAKQRLCPELPRSPRCRLVVLTIGLGAAGARKLRPVSRPLPCQLQNQTSPQCMVDAAQQPLHARWLASMLSGLRNVRRPCVLGFAHRVRLLSPIRRIRVPKLCHVPSFATWQTARAVLAAANVLSLAWKSERWVPKRLLARARAPVLRARCVRPRRTHGFTSASERRHVHVPAV